MAANAESKTRKLAFYQRSYLLQAWLVICLAPWPGGGYHER